MIWLLFFIPVISAFTGWLAGFIAIKLLFHPKRPVKISGITFQGIFPKQHQAFATKFEKLISNELFLSAEIEQRISNPTNIDKILPWLETHIDIFLREKLSAEIPMIGMLIGQKTISQVKGVFMKELKEIFPGLIQQYMRTLKQDASLEKVVIEKILQFSLAAADNDLNKVVLNEFRLIKTFGAIAGFVIGLIQVVIIIALI